MFLAYFGIAAVVVGISVWLFIWLTRPSSNPSLNDQYGNKTLFEDAVAVLSLSALQLIEDSKVPKDGCICLDRYWREGRSRREMKSAFYGAIREELRTELSGEIHLVGTDEGESPCSAGNEPWYLSFSPFRTFEGAPEIRVSIGHEINRTGSSDAWYTWVKKDGEWGLIDPQELRTDPRTYRWERYPRTLVTNSSGSKGLVM
jgi:hypothetical protein